MGAINADNRVSASDHSAQQDIEQTRVQYYLAIAIMGAGGLLILLGLHGPGIRP